MKEESINHSTVETKEQEYKYTGSDVPSLFVGPPLPPPEEVIQNKWNQIK